MLRDEGYLLGRASGVERYADSPYRHQSQLGNDALHHVLRVERHAVAWLDTSAYQCLRCQHRMLRQLLTSPLMPAFLRRTIHIA